MIIEGQAKLRGFLLSQNETLKRKEKQRAQLESALQVVNPNTSIQEYEIQTDNFGGEQFLIQSEILLDLFSIINLISTNEKKRNLLFSIC